MRRFVSVNVILLLLTGLLGLSFSVCRDFMSRDSGIRMAASCADDEFCRKMCQLGQNDCPGLLQKSSIDVQKTVISLPADPTSHPLFWSERSRLALSNEKPVVQIALGEVYLLNTAFLI